MSENDNPWAELAIAQNRRWLKAYVLAATGDPAASDDLVQDVLAIAYRKRDDFQLGTNFGGWLRTIARHVVWRYCAQRARHPLFAHDEALGLLDRVAAEAEENSCDPFFLDRRKRFLKDCLGTVRARIRDLLRWRYAEGQSSQAIAARLGMSVSAVNVAAFRARLALARCVEGKEQAEGA